MLLDHSLSVCVSVSVSCNIGVLWPNGWKDQGATWYGGRPQPRPHCVRWEPSSLHGKGHSSLQTCVRINHGPCLLWPNGCMDQDATWCGGRPGFRRHCVRLGPSSPSPWKGAQQLPPLFLAHVYCGQMAGWIRMPIGTEVGLSPGDIVLGWVPSSPTDSIQPYCSV